MQQESPEARVQNHLMLHKYFSVYSKFLNICLIEPFALLRVVLVWWSFWGCGFWLAGGFCGAKENLETSRHTTRGYSAIQSSHDS